MKRIDDRTVEFTDDEMILKVEFEDRLDNGWSIPEAVMLVREYASTVESIGGMSEIDPAFWEYLAS